MSLHEHGTPQDDPNDASNVFDAVQLISLDGMSSQVQVLYPTHPTPINPMYYLRTLRTVCRLWLAGSPPHPVAVSRTISAASQGARGQSSCQI